MPGSSPKRKGDGYERELAKYFNEKIFNGEDKVQRMPLSGGGAIKGDVIINNDIEEWVLEVKCRANGFKEIYKWIENNDALIIKADNKKALAVLDMNDFFNILSTQKKKGEADVT